MPYAIALPSTSTLSFSSNIRSHTHPSLPVHTTTSRNVLRAALKDYHSLPSNRSESGLVPVSSALEGYIPLLLAISTGLSSNPTVSGEEVDVVLLSEVQVQWRSLIARDRSIDKKRPRVRASGLDAEIAFTLSTLAATFYLRAKQRLRHLFDARRDGGALDSQLRTTTIALSKDDLLNANSIYTHLASFMHTNAASQTPLEISHSAFTSLTSLTIAEATLLMTLKDDPYPSIVAAQRNANDTDWMVGAPSIPKIRARIFVGLCVASSDHASHGAAACDIGKSKRMAGGQDRSLDGLQDYLGKLRTVAKAKACRFAAIDAEAQGKVGEAIGWLQAAALMLDKKQALPASASDSGKSKVGQLAAKLKRTRLERTEDSLIEKDGQWGSDAGALEELRIIEMLLEKWKRLNDTVSFEAVPSPEELLAMLPSGRGILTSEVWTPPTLDASVLAAMRAPPDPEEQRKANGVEDDDSSDNESPGPDPIPKTPGSYY